MDIPTGNVDLTPAESTRQSRIQVLAVAGAGPLLLSGLVHPVLAPAEWAEAPYLGALFAAEFVGSAAAAVGVYRDRRWGWWLGVAVAVGAIVAYVVAGTVGLPVVPRAPLLEPLGVGTKAVEVVFLGVAAVRLTD